MILEAVARLYWALPSTEPRIHLQQLWRLAYLPTSRHPHPHPHPEARSVASLARAVSRRSPHRQLPCVVRSPALFSACSQHTRSPACVWCVCLPAIRAFQRHSTRHLLRYRSPPFGFHFCFRSVPSGFVQRTGCSACGLGHPHQVWWAPPSHVHSSYLATVSFAGMSTYLRLQPPRALAPVFAHCRFVSTATSAKKRLSQPKKWFSHGLTAQIRRLFLLLFSRPPPWWWLALSAQASRPSGGGCRCGPRLWPPSRPPSELIPAGAASASVRGAGLRPASAPSSQQATPN
jgi:hypothetical protein